MKISCRRNTATQIELNEVQEIIIRESRKFDAKQNEYNLTKSMVDNLEGFPESIRFLKKNTGWAKNAPLFSDILYCREEYRVAIENYLEPLMNHYVVDTYNEAIRAINLLGVHRREGRSFLCWGIWKRHPQPDSYRVRGGWRHPSPPGSRG